MYGPLRRPSSSSCGGLWPLTKLLVSDIGYYTLHIVSLHTVRCIHCRPHKLHRKLHTSQCSLPSGRVTSGPTLAVTLRAGQLGTEETGELCVADTLLELVTLGIIQGRDEFSQF